MALHNYGILTFLYPCLARAPLRLGKSSKNFHAARLTFTSVPTKRYSSSEALIATDPSHDDVLPSSHLNPPPSDYGRTIFADKAKLNVTAGGGGHGCISFFRDAFVQAGPPNGGNGGSGGNIYIQAVRGETSLHKLARRSNIKAGRGKNGMGSSLGGKRGEDVLILVPVGTVVRETGRVDPVAQEEESRLLIGGGKDPEEESEEDMETRGTWRRDKWILYPSATPGQYAREKFPPIPRPRRSSLASMQPESPITLDLSEPMERPILLAAGAVGGLGNPHFVTKNRPFPKFATRGLEGMSLTLELELKLLADVGFVGVPNAGKSTLLRALSRSRARVGEWAFTTLHPNIGTVVLDNNIGRPQIQATHASGEPRKHLSIADIPGLVMDAHRDRGLGLGFLRHVERAQVLAFVVDLGNGNAIDQLKTLWNELGEFEKLKGAEINIQSESRIGIVDWKPFGSVRSSKSDNDDSTIIEPSPSQKLPPLPINLISSKPWFVVATKADKPGTQDNFKDLKMYLDALMQGAVDHPSGRKNTWKGKLAAIPVSAIKGEGVDKIPEWTVGLLDD